MKYNFFEFIYICKGGFVMYFIYWEMKNNTFHFFVGEIFAWSGHLYL